MVHFSQAKMTKYNVYINNQYELQGQWNMTLQLTAMQKGTSVINFVTT